MGWNELAELNQQEKMAADQHLQDLKRDLEATMEDWRRSEQERDAKDKVNSQLQTVTFISSSAFIYRYFV